MGSTAVIGATERTSSGAHAADTSAGTVVIHPDETARLRLGDVPPDESPAGAAMDAAGHAAPATTTAADARAAISGSVAETNTSPMRRRLLGAGATTAVAVAVIIAFLVLTGGEAVTAAERATFVEQCEAREVPTRLCQCAVDRSISQLDAELFRAGLAVMVSQDGELIDEFKEQFVACQADGF
jgi:hypothetical protein